MQLNTGMLAEIISPSTQHERTIIKQYIPEHTFALMNFLMSSKPAARSWTSSGVTRSSSSFCCALSHFCTFAWLRASVDSENGRSNLESCPLLKFTRCAQASKRLIHSSPCRAVWRLAFKFRSPFIALTPALTKICT